MLKFQVPLFQDNCRITEITKIIIVEKPQDCKLSSQQVMRFSLSLLYLPFFFLIKTLTLVLKIQNRCNDKHIAKLSTKLQETRATSPDIPDLKSKLKSAHS